MTFGFHVGKKKKDEESVAPSLNRRALEAAAALGSQTNAQVNNTVNSSFSSYSNDSTLPPLRTAHHEEGGVDRVRTPGSGYSSSHHYSNLNDFFSPLASGTQSTASFSKHHQHDHMPVGSPASSSFVSARAPTPKDDLLSARGVTRRAQVTVAGIASASEGKGDEKGESWHQQGLPRVSSSSSLASSFHHKIQMLSNSSFSNWGENETVPHNLRHLKESELLLVKDVDKTRESFISVAGSFNYETDTPVDWDAVAWPKAASMLSTDVTKGLTTEEAARRLEKYGENALDKEKPVSIFTIFVRQLLNFIIMLLIVASIAAFAIGHLAEGIAILVIISLNSVIATIQEKNAGNALAALAQMSSQKCMVIRDGRSQVIDAELLVPGDIVELTAGDVVPADLLLASSSDLKINEMLLTGESDDVAKHSAVPTVTPHQRRTLKSGKDSVKSITPVNVPKPAEDAKKLTPPNMCYSSTTVCEGKGRAIVVETGMRTRVGKIAALLKRENTDNEVDVVEEQRFDLQDDVVHGRSHLDSDGEIPFDFEHSFGSPKKEKQVTTKKSKAKKKQSWIARIKKCSNQNKPKETPLQKSLHQLGVFIGIAAIIICIIVFIVGILRKTTDPQHPDRSPAINMIMIAVSLAVSAIPEGLPMVVTICLTSGTVSMVKRHVIVRRLAAVETLGCASVICTDKTGTLTQGKMSVVEIWNAFRSFQVTGKGFQPVGDILHGGVSQLSPSVTPSGSLLKALLSLTVLCSDTVIREEEIEGPEGEAGQGEKQWTYVGNSSEAPLVVCAAKAQIDPAPLHDTFPRVSVVPFSSKRKLMLSVHSLKPKNNERSDAALEELSQAIPSLASSRFAAVVKGAPQVLLPYCTHVVSETGQIVPFGTAEEDGLTSKQAIDKYIDDMSERALRVLAVTFRLYSDEGVDEPGSAYPWNDPFCEDSDEKVRAILHDTTGGKKRGGPIVLAGLFASIDPERDGVKEAVQVARDAGVRTMMITGDYLKTAVAIAKNISLFPFPIAEDGEGVERTKRMIQDSSFDCSCLRITNQKGEDEYLPDQTIDEMTRRAVVFARAKPEDKLIIVKSLRRQGFVSAMTGDGVNDSPALKESDIGIAMGITGTEVAKGASDMILTDDNFVSIVAAIEKGRVIYGNVKKFVFFLLSTNLGEVMLILTTIAVGMPIPFEPVQVLILNLLSDGMPATALSLEKGDVSVMKTPPRSPREYIITGRRQWSSFVIIASIIFLSTFLVYSIALWASTGVLLQDELLQGKDITNPDEIFVCRRYVINEGFQDITKCSPDSPPSDDVVCLREDADNCVSDGLAMARTTAFISITFAEMLRAYTARYFDRPVWYRITENKYLHAAALFSLSLTVLLVLTPGIKDAFGFRYLPAWYWALALGGSLLTVTLTEIVKAIFTRLPSFTKSTSQVLPPAGTAA